MTAPIRLYDPFVVTYYVQDKEALMANHRSLFSVDEVNKMRFPIVIGMDDVPQWMNAQEYRDHLGVRMQALNRYLFPPDFNLDRILYVTLGDQQVPIQLTHAESVLLHCLMEANRVVSNGELLNLLESLPTRNGKERNYTKSTRSSLVHVMTYRIRSKVRRIGGPTLLEVMHGVGCRYVGGSNFSMAQVN